MRLSPKQLEALKILEKGGFLPALVEEDDGWHARWRAIGVDNDWVDEYVRRAAMTRLTEDAEDQRHETIHDAWLMALRSRTGLVRYPAAECAEFAKELRGWSERAESVPLAFRFRSRGQDFFLECDLPRGRKALRALGQATYVVGSLRSLRLAADGKTLSAKLTRSEAEDFLLRGARQLREADYAVEGVEIVAPVTASADVGGRGEEVKLTVRVAGKPVTADEIRFLLDQGASLVYFRDEWIYVDRFLLRQALRALEKGAETKANPLVFALGLGHFGTLELEEVRTHGWIRGLVEEMRRAGREVLAETKPPKGFVGELRDYQALGVEWLKFMGEHGLGALLADDMGLGKTVQTVAWLLACGHGRHLVVAPLTLLANWRHELVRFAPSLSVYVHHGSDRRTGGLFAEATIGADVTLTSYNLLVRDYRLFAGVGWDTLVLDEAQAIKNAETQVARAARALSPRRRLALTGTPIENSVADVWSIEEFLNPGFLGDAKQFAERFVKPIALDPCGRAARRLSHALEPFILRRKKSDPGIAAELGPKREVREYCPIAAEQRTEYEAALADFRASEHAQGDVFALLTRLKLVCDWGGVEPLESSGKFERLAELLEGIFAGGESALVFTQYAKVGAWLQKKLAERFGRRFPFLHGSLPAKERERLVDAFTSTRRAEAFILSLKAGGFGLNLTKATHVIHFDRWWNPAVENQATDRAHRIGQRQTVFVHLMMTAGTLEEHIDNLLARKRSLGELLVNGEEFYRAVKLDE